MTAEASAVGATAAVPDPLPPLETGRWFGFDTAAEAGKGARGTEADAACSCLG